MATSKDDMDKLASGQPAPRGSQNLDTTFAQQIHPEFPGIEEAPKPRQTPTYSVRPSKELLPRLQHLAADVGKSEALVMQESVTAILDMIELGYDFVPPLVQRARIIREHLATLKGNGLLGGGASIEPPDSFWIKPSESVRGISARLHFLPLYQIVPPDKERLGFFTQELIGAPRSKALGAEFAFDPGRTPKSSTLGFSYDPGTILLGASPESILAANKADLGTNDKSSPKQRTADDYSRRYRGVMGRCGKHAFVGEFEDSGWDFEKPQTLIKVASGLYNDKEYEFETSKCSIVWRIVGAMQAPKTSRLVHDESEYPDKAERSYG